MLLGKRDQVNRNITEPLEILSLFHFTNCLARDDVRDRVAEWVFALKLWVASNKFQVGDRIRHFLITNTSSARIFITFSGFYKRSRNMPARKLIISICKEESPHIIVDENFHNRPWHQFVYEPVRRIRDKPLVLLNDDSQ